MVKRYIWNVLIGLDQFGNTLFGGDPDMTLSGNMGRKVKTGECIVCKPICRFIAFAFRDPNHCANQDTAEQDEGKDQLI